MSSRALSNPESAEPSEIVTVQEAAQILGISHQGVYAAIRRGALKTVERVVTVQGIARTELARYREGKAA